METIIGIDPGMTGSIATWDGKCLIVHNMPSTEREVYELLHEIASQSRTNGPVEAVIEEVGGFIGKGLPGSRMFNFGRNFGFLLGCLTSLDIRIKLVRPQTWMKSLGMGTRGKLTKTEWKNHLWQKAKELYPSSKFNKQCGDAVLLVEYGRRNK